MYFYKIDVDLPKIDESRLKGNFFEGYGETYREFYIKDPSYLKDFIKHKINFTIKPDHVVFVEVNELGADPHFDEASVSFNYYIDPADCETRFWKTKENANHIVLPQLNEEGNLVANSVRRFAYEDLNQVASFIANAGDFYVLNIKEIHSAQKILPNKNTRKLIRWMWNKENFHNVVHSIKILN